MVEECLEIFRPLILPRASSLNSNLKRTSEPKMKRKGEKGPPCLRPLSGENLLKGLPFWRMEKRRRGDAQFDPINPGGMETKFLHNSQDENPLYFIKGFLHVHIEKHEASFPFFVFERM
jgi:hypothetical protein